MPRKPKDPELARLRQNAKRAAEKIKTAKVFKKLGLKPFPTARQYKAQKLKEVKALPTETKQAVLDAYHNPELRTYEEIVQKTGLTLMQVVYVLEINTEWIKYRVIKKETV